MDTIQHFDNENLKERGTYLLWLFVAIAGILAIPFLSPLFVSHKHYDSTAEWTFTCSAILIFVAYFIFFKRFVSISFDDANKKIALTITSLISGDRTEGFSYADITFNSGRDAGSLRKPATEFIEILNKRKKVLRIEKTTVGEYCFENILTYLEELKKLF